MDAAERNEILNRYRDHSRRFEAVAQKRGSNGAEVIPFAGPLQELEQEPTGRELEVLQLVANGVTTQGIAEQLSLSPNTVRSYVESAIRKLGARGRTHAVAEAFRRQLIV